MQLGPKPYPIGPVSTLVTQDSNDEVLQRVDIMNINNRKGLAKVRPKANFFFGHKVDVPYLATIYS